MAAVTDVCVYKPLWGQAVQVQEYQVLMIIEPEPLIPARLHQSLVVLMTAPTRDLAQTSF